MEFCSSWTLHLFRCCEPFSLPYQVGHPGKPKLEKKIEKIFTKTTLRSQKSKAARSVRARQNKSLKKYQTKISLPLQFRVLLPYLVGHQKKGLFVTHATYAISDKYQKKLKIIFL